MILVKSGAKKTRQVRGNAWPRHLPSAPSATTRDSLAAAAPSWQKSPSLCQAVVDFIKIIRSIEEFLYEAMTWLLFYPRTLWRCVRHPDWIIAYTDKELGETPGEQFTDLISPPLFLIISVVVAHGLEWALGERLPTTSSPLVAEIVASEQNLLIFRALLFSVFPLVMAAGLLHTRGTPIDRDTLRSPSSCSAISPRRLPSPPLRPWRSCARTARPTKSSGVCC